MSLNEKEEVTLSSIYKEKERCEQKILEAITEFNEKTSLNVEDIMLDYTDIELGIVMHCVERTYDVKLKVEL